ncbi:primosomal protein N' [candidate division NPL-UPA2 bacterium]|nr:primosomal protein N' [candidate division NPL-UPA2 bacterium]
MAREYAQIVVGLPIDRIFHYSIPEGMREEIDVGKRVMVPFAGQRLTGYVVGLSSQAPIARVKEIGAVLDPFPIFDSEILQLTRWMADYYACAWGEVLRVASPPRMKRVGRKREEKSIEKPPLLIPTPEQAEALKLIGKGLEKNNSTTFLLHGVTGSGKTEIYLQSIARVLEKGKQAIVLLPEISLTPQILLRFGSRFWGRIAPWHSRLSRRERFQEWMRMREGEADIVVGARSAIFAPFKNLGLIVIDEEHETSYKQTESPKYHAREVALERARLSGAAVILGTATPSLESYFQARRGKYELTELTTRVDGKIMPEVEIVDMRKELTVRGNRSIFSLRLQHSMRECLERKEQVILFLNRRGFSTFVLCQKCGQALRCKYCDVSFTYHSKTERLHCHYCNYQEEKPQVCPKCQSGQVGYFGVGTQKVESELRRLLPEARIGRMDSDTTTRKRSYSQILGSFQRHGIDILVGTQMIAKGLDFPRVTLVGVISADTALNLADFRASERTFQLLTQVAGRAGRGDVHGQVIIQTYNPEHYSIQTARLHDYPNFYGQEIKFRRELGYPPFSHLINVTLQSRDGNRLRKVAGKLGRILEANNREAIDILGPAPAPLARIKGKWRWQIILKGSRTGEMRELLKESLSQLKEPASGRVRISLDVDPMGML